VLWPRGRLSL